MLVNRVVSGTYFETVGTRLKSGRTFAAIDVATAPPVVILSESMARYYFKNQYPVGRHLSFKLFNGNWSNPAEVIGVAADSRADGIDQEPMILSINRTRKPARNQHCSCEPPD